MDLENIISVHAAEVARLGVVHQYVAGYRYVNGRHRPMTTLEARASSANLDCVLVASPSGHAAMEQAMPPEAAAATPTPPRAACPSRSRFMFASLYSKSSTCCAQVWFAVNDSVS